MKHSPACFRVGGGRDGEKTQLHQHNRGARKRIPTGRAGNRPANLRALGRFNKGVIKGEVTVPMVRRGPWVSAHQKWGGVTF